MVDDDCHGGAGEILRAQSQDRVCRQAIPPEERAGLDRKTRNQARVAARLLEQGIEWRPLAQITYDLVSLDYCFDRVHGASLLKSPKQEAMTILEIVDQYKDEVAKNEKADEKHKRQRKAIEEDSKVAKPLSGKNLGLSLVATNRHYGFLRQLAHWFFRYKRVAELNYVAFITQKEGDARDELLTRAYPKILIAGSHCLNAV